MTTQEMCDLVKDRSRQPDQAKILRELRSAFRWATLRVYNTEGGKDLLSTIGQELTLATDTRDYDLAANLTGTFLGLKQLWVKFPTDLTFTPIQEADPTAPTFQDLDAELDGEETVAAGFPVVYKVYNFGIIRFAPMLPAGAILRADFAKFGPAPDPSTNPTATSGADLTDLFHDAICAKATAHCLENLDDERVAGWETRARDFLQDALYAAQKRVQGPVAHQGWTSRRRRWSV